MTGKEVGWLKAGDGMRKLWSVAPGGMLALAGAGIAAALLALPVMAADDVAAVVAKRRETMKTMAANVKTVAEFAQGKAGRDDAVAAAKVIQDIAARVPSLFPPGTGMEALPGKSGAKPEIWTDPQKFKDAAAALVQGSAALARSVDTGDAGNVGASLRTLGQTACTACHDTYRVKI